MDSVCEKYTNSCGCVCVRLLLVVFNRCGRAGMVDSCTLCFAWLVLSVLIVCTAAGCRVIVGMRHLFVLYSADTKSEVRGCIRPLLRA